jgi:hypothetical protein
MFRPFAMCGVHAIDDAVLASFKVHIRANFFTRLVLVLTPLIDASLSICLTLCLQLCIGWARHEHIDVAFDLLGGRPIDLSVLLGALHPVHFFIKMVTASFAASHLVHIACCPESLSVVASV